MICSSTFWKNVRLCFSSFNPYRPTLRLARGTNRQFYCTGVIVYNKLDNYFFVSADRETFLGFEMAANLHDTSPFNCAYNSTNQGVVTLHKHASEFELNWLIK